MKIDYCPLCGKAYCKGVTDYRHVNQQINTQNFNKKVINKKVKKVNKYNKLVKIANDKNPPKKNY